MNKKSEIRLILKYITFMKIAEKLGSLSYDEKHQVGAILVKNDFTNITAIGYNGNYAGGTNERDSMEHGMSGYLHAEENLIGNTALPKEIVSDYYTAFVTMTPCHMCAKRLIGKGIKRIVYLNEYINCGNSHEIFDSVDVECVTLKDITKKLFKKTYLFKDLNTTIGKTFINNGFQFEKIHKTALIELTKLLNSQIVSVFETNQKALDCYIESEVNIDITKINYQDVTKIMNSFFDEYFDLFFTKLYKLL